MATLPQPNISAVANDSYEVQPLLLKKHAFKGQCSQKFNIRCPKYKLAKISEKGAMFMIIWNLFYTTALFSCLTLLGMINNTVYIQYIVVTSVSVLYPVIGLVTDAWIRTFRVIKLSL